MQSIIIKSLLILFNLIQWLIVFLSGFAIMFPLHQEQIETSKYGIGHYWFLITVFALWRFFKRFSRYILLKLAIMFDKSSSTNFESIFNKFLDSEVTNLNKVKAEQSEAEAEEQKEINKGGHNNVWGGTGSDFDKAKKEWNNNDD